MKVVKIENTKNKPFTFVPYGQNFTCTIKSEDVLEFECKGAEMQLYYEKQQKDGVNVTMQDDFDVDGLIKFNDGDVVNRIVIDTQAKSLSWIEDFCRRVTQETGDVSNNRLAYIRHNGGASAYTFGTTSYANESMWALNLVDEYNASKAISCVNLTSMGYDVGWYDATDLQNPKPIIDRYVYIDVTEGTFEKLMNFFDEINGVVVGNATIIGE